VLPVHQSPRMLEPEDQGSRRHSGPGSLAPGSSVPGSLSAGPLAPGSLALPNQLERQRHNSPGPNSPVALSVGDPIPEAFHTPRGVGVAKDFDSPRELDV